MLTNPTACARKHAQPFCAILRGVGADLDPFEPHRLEWSDLNRVERDARKHAKALSERLDGVDETRAAEMEAAFDALIEIADACRTDKDGRSQRGDRGPWAGVDLDRRPIGHIGSAPAFDGGEASDAPEGYALRSGETLTAWARARSHDDHPPVKAGAFLRALATGARNDAERRALAAGTDAAGGYTVPTTTSAELIDLARSNMVLAEAGARVVPLDTGQHVIAKLASDPVAAWRVENAAVNESDPTFDGVTLAPKSIAVLVKASVELMSDSVNLERELPNVLARALAVEIDRAGLVGSGSGPEPLGIAGFSGLTANGFAGGALSTYTPLMQARGALHGANERFGTAIMAARDENALASAVDGDGQPLLMPRALEAVQMLHTTAIPTDGGAGSDEGKAICGDFTQLLMGVRQEIRVEILRERYMDNLQFGLICHARVDFAAARESAFTVLDAITPA